jgi:hypothetical protein
MAGIKAESGDTTDAVTFGVASTARIISHARKALE